MDQVFTLIWLKFKMMTHKLCHATGIANLVVQIIFLISNAFMSLVIAAVFGGLIYLTGRTAGAPNLLTVSYIMFYTFFFFGVVIPCLSAGGNLAFEPAQFLVYPLSRSRLYLISLAANIFNLEHMLYYPALLTVAIIEIFVFRSGLLLAFMIPFCIALFYIVWNNTLILML